MNPVAAVFFLHVVMLMLAFPALMRRGLGMTLLPAGQTIDHPNAWYRAYCRVLAFFVCSCTSMIVTPALLSPFFQAVDLRVVHDATIEWRALLFACFPVPLAWPMYVLLTKRMRSRR